MSWLSPTWLLVALIAGILAYVQGRDDGQAVALATMNRDAQVAAVATAAAMDGAASAIAALKPVHQTITQTLQKEVRESTVFRDCRSGDVSLRAFNSSIPAAAGAHPAASGVVPEPHAAD